jgi:hypothetical protein
MAPPDFDVAELYRKLGSELHRKIDETRDAYFGFIFPVNRSDLTEVSNALELSPAVAQAIYRDGRAFSTFAPVGRPGQLTNHIFGATLLALRGKSLDEGLAAVTDQSIETLVEQHEATVLEIAAVRASWFGRIYFPAVAFANAIGVFGGRAGPDALYRLAERYGFAGRAGERSTIRGDFGIAVWLTLLARSP